jgi:hypothetical protein
MKGQTRHLQLISVAKKEKTPASCLKENKWKSRYYA